MKKLLLLFSLVVMSCNSGKIQNSTSIMSSEAVVIASVKIMNKGKDITKNSKIFFDENKKGTLSYRLSEDGVLITKLPIGNHFIKMIYTPYGSVNLPDGYASFNISANKAYYIGDLEIQTDGMLSKKYQGAIYDRSPKWKQEKKLKIKISTSQEPIKQYEREFGNRLIIEQTPFQLEENY